jgi:hypothetical protein
MTDRLTLYNEALGHLGERRLGSLAEARAPRRVLDDFYDQVAAYCLERKFWNFSYRAGTMNASTNYTPSFGWLYGFPIPGDWIRTRRISAVPQFDEPLLQVAEEAGWWYANINPIYVQYNSSDPSYGMNLGAWPASFADYVALRLARMACKRVTGSEALLAGPDGLIKQEEKAYKVAAANCAMNEAVGFAPQSSWVKSRRWPGPNMDNPTGPTLIP